MSTPERSSIFQNKSLLITLVGCCLIAAWLTFRLLLPNQPTWFAGTPPTHLGLDQGHLVSCPTTPNCVSSQSLDESHQIAPIPYSGSASMAISALRQVIESFPRTQIITVTDDYLYATFSTPLMGFVDDVEFYLNPATQVIEVRSASRLGESDLGVNRQRVETIRTQLEPVLTQST